MGLAEKRLAESIKVEKIPAFEAKLKDKAGYDIKVDVDWNTFTAYDEYPLSRLDIVFDDLESFVKRICSDDMGKEALQEKMSTIHLTNSDNNDDVKMELKDNTLSLTVQLVQGSFSSQTDSQIADYVEKLL
ncbi:MULTISPECIES: hypothetical protein [Flavobacterium]|uniref:Uncharacterized protein n=1 Tax=Flavobacterium salmonis TaxID=2654844 RepID=A0A6V6ZBP5_9FLAO|nr:MULTISPECIES: hypothetical protein [Flavobacterium]OOV16496.1 hypothetical protein BXU10_20270 [Flavobacterium sp. LM4]CAD0008844.1 hypothetical protein FLAT13_04590 [Flavobacterium salmonis]